MKMQYTGLQYSSKVTKKKRRRTRRHGIRQRSGREASVLVSVEELHVGDVFHVPVTGGGVQHPLDVGPAVELLHKYKLDGEGVYQQIREFLNQE